MNILLDNNCKLKGKEENNGLFSIFPSTKYCIPQKIGEKKHIYECKILGNKEKIIYNHTLHECNYIENDEVYCGKNVTITCQKIVDYNFIKFATVVSVVYSLFFLFLIWALKREGYIKFLKKLNKKNDFKNNQDRQNNQEWETFKNSQEEIELKTI